MGGWRTSVRASLLLGGFFVCSVARAIDDSNVLVLYNNASEESIEIAQYYQQVHPGVQLLGLNGVSTSEDITADQYLSTIYQPVKSALTPQTQVIVTTKGLPLRIQVTEAEPSGSPPTYTDPNGIQRTISSWKTYSSLESELADIDKVGSWQMMGDQSYSLPLQFAKNPYYGSTTSFDHATTGTRLTARLDGYTLNDASNPHDLDQIKGMIDRAQHAFVGPTNSPNGPFHFLVDNDPSKTYASSMVNLANNLTQAGLPVTYDNTSAFVGTTTGPLIGYDSHGTNAGLTPPNYITSGLNVTLAPGAIFNSWESYNAYSFNVGGYPGTQGQLAQWLEIGGTAAVGNVQEPTASISTVANEDKMFAAMLNGKTFAEAAWSSLRQLSWVNTVVGDPLMTWKMLLPGDSNMDGHVDGFDLSIIGAHWGQTFQPGGYGWTLGDVNGDGIVDISDLAEVGAYWGQTSAWAGGPPAFGAAPPVPGPYIGPTDGAPISIPEPASWLLAALGIGSLFAFRRSALRRRALAPARP